MSLSGSRCSSIIEGLASASSSTAKAPARHHTPAACRHSATASSSSVTTARPPISHSGSSGAPCTVIAFIAPPPSLGHRSFLRRTLTHRLQDYLPVHLVRLVVAGHRVPHEADSAPTCHLPLAPSARPPSRTRSALPLHLHTT